MTETIWKDEPDTTGFWWRGLPGEAAELVYVDTFLDMEAFNVRTILFSQDRGDLWRKGPKGRYHHTSRIGEKMPPFKWKHLPSELVPA